MYKFLKPNNPQIVLGDSLDSELFVKLLKTKWIQLHDETDVFKYKIDRIQEKILDGKYLLQLNPDRGIKRRKPEVMGSITQAFDKRKFNFTQVTLNEKLFDLVKEGKESDIHSLIVNVSPISLYHTLLCPSLSQCLPQVLTEESIVLALDVMFLAHDRDLRIVFNSLCGMASVNHLHYHIFLEPNTLPIETAKCKPVKGRLLCFEDYPAPGFCFQVDSTETIATASKDIFKLITYFLKNSIAHNLMISRGRDMIPGEQKLVFEKRELLPGEKGMLPKERKLIPEEKELVSEETELCRVIVWPRKHSSKPEYSTFNVATCELSGWLPIYDENSFNSLTSQELENELRRWKVDNFDSLCEDLKLLF